MCARAPTGRVRHGAWLSTLARTAWSGFD